MVCIFRGFLYNFTFFGHQNLKPKMLYPDPYPQPTDVWRRKFYNFLVIKTLDPDPHWPKMLDPDLHLYHWPNNYKDTKS